MSTKLASVLDHHDLPATELSAAKLDGEVFTVDEGFASIDTVCDRRLRAQALTAVGQLGTVMGLSAAWVYGALLTPPAVHEVIAASRLSGLARRGRLHIRESDTEDDDVVEVEGLRLTAPVRTIVDLARRDDTDPALLAVLADQTGTSSAQCQRWLDRAPKLAGARRARSVITALKRGDPRP